MPAKGILKVEIIKIVNFPYVTFPYLTVLVKTHDVYSDLKK